jgi:hypothetical protein
VQDYIEMRELYSDKMGLPKKDPIKSRVLGRPRLRFYDTPEMNGKE